MTTPSGVDTPGVGPLFGIDHDDQEGAQTAYSTGAADDLLAAKRRIEPHIVTWDAAKRATNPYELVNASSIQSRTRPVSRSYFKLREMFTVFPDLARAASSGGHAAMVAEGPGGFAQAAIDQGCQDVRVVTLVSSVAPRMRVTDYRARCITGDGSGDITRIRVRKAFLSVAAGASLFTADGGFDMCGDFEQQEARSSKLIEIEVAMGVAVLAMGGVLVVKMFDTFTPRSRSVLSWVAECFDRTYIYKPCTSRPANSERYVVGIGFDRACATTRALADWTLGTTAARPPGVRGYAESIDRIGCALAARQTRSITAALKVVSTSDRERSTRVQLESLLRWCQRHGMRTNGRDLIEFRRTLTQSEKN